MLHMAKENKDRTYALSYGSCTGQCRIIAVGGAGVEGRGEARTSRAHGGKQRSSSPPIHRYALLVTPVSCPRIRFRFLSFLRRQGNHCCRVPRHSVGILLHQDCSASSFAMMVGGVCQRPTGPPAFF